MRKTLSALLLILLLSATAARADVSAAYSAMDRGNLGEALAIFQKDAEKGDAEAQYALGEMYYDGKGVTRDVRQAAQWMTKAAESGMADAEVFLGGLYFVGEGVKQDYVAAVTWYSRAAAQGNVDAEFNMGYMYEFGYGVSIDCDKSEEWYSKAASQGDEEAQEILDSFSCREYANVALL